MTTVLHTADTHVGYRQYNSPERQEDFLTAFERVLSDAVEDDVDAVVHAGDVFHDRRPGLVDLLGTVSALRVLDEADVPFLAIVGNHEDKREAQWLDLFETMGLATRLDASGTVVGDVTFYGLDYVPPSRRDELDYEFEPPDTEHAALIAHGQFAPLAPSIRGATWDVEAVLEASNVDFDAVLLGDEHVHERAELGGTWVTYPGSTERTSASERDERGYNLVAFDDEVRIRRRGIETREFAFIDVDLREGEGIERVRERVREHDLTDAVALVTVDGEGEPVTPAEIEEYAREQGAMVARVNDRRELATEEEAVDVEFADPDAAVRERVRDLGLSSAARDIDETVRSTGIADSNVREEVKRRVEELLDEDPDAFERVPDDTDGDHETEETATDDQPADPGGDGETPAAVDDDSDVGSAAGATEDAATTDDVASPDGDATTVDDGTTVVDDDVTDDGVGTDPDDAEGDSPSVDDAATTGGEVEAEESSTDGQASMEEYL